MLGLRTLGRAVRQLAGSLAALSATVDQANSTLRRRLALDVQDATHSPQALPSPAEGNGTPATAPSPRRNGKRVNTGS